MKTYEDILNLEMPINDAGAKTIKQYLEKLLKKVWEERERFNGKRPFGNSSWKYELLYVLCINQIIPCSLDEYGDIDYTDKVIEHGESMIAELIGFIFRLDKRVLN